MSVSFLYDGFPVGPTTMKAVRAQNEGSFSFVTVYDEGRRRLSDNNLYDVVRTRGGDYVLSNSFYIHEHDLKPFTQMHDVELIATPPGIFVYRYLNKTSVYDSLISLEQEVPVNPLLFRSFNLRSDCKCTSQYGDCLSNGIDVSERCGCGNHGGSVPFCYVEHDCSSSSPSSWKEGVSYVTCEDPDFPSDQFFQYQWHLHNTGQLQTPGIDVRTLSTPPTPNSNVVVVAVVDDGVDVDHEDLASGIDMTLSYDWNDDTPHDPRPSASNMHGTAVAGLLGARKNGLGVLGSCWDCTLAIYRLLASPITALDEYQSFTKDMQQVHVKSNSWGPNDGQIHGMHQLTYTGLIESINEGRNKKGTIHVFAAGNGGRQDGLNFDGYANSPYTISVSGIAADGSFPYYSEYGSCIGTSAPSSGYSTTGLVTTDVSGPNGYVQADYMNGFGHTSGAAPLVSGIIGLMLRARPELGWRDVQEILLFSSTKVSSIDGGWIVNGAGMNYHHLAGPGLVNANSSVRMSMEWDILGPRVEHAINLPNFQGVHTFTVNTGLRIEHVVIKCSPQPDVHAKHMRLSLVSPSGTAALLIAENEVHYPLPASWNFTSLVTWGEYARGDWTINSSHELGSVTVAFYGTSCADKDDLCSQTSHLCATVYRKITGLCDNTCDRCTRSDILDRNANISLLDELGCDHDLRQIMTFVDKKEDS